MEVYSQIFGGIRAGIIKSYWFNTDDNSKITLCINYLTGTDQKATLYIKSLYQLNKIQEEFAKCLAQASKNKNAFIGFTSDKEGYLEGVHLLGDKAIKQKKA